MILSCQGEGSGRESIASRREGRGYAEGRGVGWSIASQGEGSGRESIASREEGSRLGHCWEGSGLEHC